MLGQIHFAHPADRKPGTKLVLVQLASLERFFAKGVNHFGPNYCRYDSDRHHEQTVANFHGCQKWSQDITYFWVNGPHDQTREERQPSASE